jgi:DNA topoisomerase I
MSTDPSLGWWLRVGTPKRGFRYIGLNGRELRSEAALARVRALVIPPAWTDVHIAPDAKRKVQAWGYDQAGRRQYRYSEGHVAKRDRRKWNRVVHVGRALPELRAATNEHLKRESLDRQKVLATVVRLMSRAFFRAGSERYAVENRTFGICTLSKKHVRLEGDSLVFTYAGKRRIDQHQVVADTPLVAILEELMELPGRRLFQYLAEDGNGKRPARKPVTAAGVNRYLREILGEKVTSKDLRTFGGTVRAATILADIGPAQSAREASKNVVLTCKLVAQELGNTPAICRKAYIHPAVLEEYERAGRTVELPSAGPRSRRRSAPKRRRPERRRRPRVPSQEAEGLYPEEIALLRFLEKYG